MYVVGYKEQSVYSYFIGTTSVLLFLEVIYVTINENKTPYFGNV